MIYPNGIAFGVLNALAEFKALLRSRSLKILVGLTRLLLYSFIYSKSGSQHLHKNNLGMISPPSPYVSDRFWEMHGKIFG